MGDRVADPRPAARPERPAGRGLAPGRGRLRLQVRRPLLPVDQGLRPGERASTGSSRRAATSPASGRATTPSAACTRRPPTRCVRGAVDLETADHQGRSRTCSTRSASTASAPSPAAASGSGAPAPSPRDPAWRYLNVRRLLQLPRGVDPARHPVGGVRAERPRAVGPHPAQHLRVPHRRVAQGRAVRRAPPRRRSTSSATRRPTRRSPIDLGQVVCEIGIAPVKPAEFVDLPAGPVLRRHQPASAE